MLFHISWSNLGSLVCHPCRGDVTKIVRNPEFVPRWEKSMKTCKEKVSHKCCVSECSSLSFVSTALGTSEQLKSAFNNTQLKYGDAIPVPTPLCQYHYHIIYDEIQGVPRQCLTCGMSLRHNIHRRPPQPKELGKYLREHTSFEGEVLSTSRVCLTCYRGHLVMLQEYKPISTDSDLRKVLDASIKNSPSIEEVTSKNLIQVAMAKTLNKVGQFLLQKKALLLPNIQQLFRSIAEDIILTRDIKDPPNIQDITCKWILHDLVAHLQHHVAYSCKVRKYGTLVRANSDVVPFLNEVMWQYQNVMNSQKEPQSDDREPDCAQSYTYLSSTGTNTVNLDKISELITDQISTFLANDSQTPFEIDELHIDDIISNIHGEWYAH